MAEEKVSEQFECRPRLVKLVRDRVGAFLGPDATVSYDFVPEGDRLALLRRKLIEEAAEYLADPSLAELADVFEVVRCVTSAEGWGMGRVIEEANAKVEERGSFVLGTGMYVEMSAPARTRRPLAHEPKLRCERGTRCLTRHRQDPD